MNQRNRELLVGYLLGALDDAEQELVARKLESDPVWKAELEVLRAELEPLEQLEDEGEFEAPSGLAERTCEFVEQSLDAQVDAARSRLAAGMAGTRNGVTFADTIVAAGVFLATAMLFFPAISNSRYLSRLTQCQNNLRQIGLAMAEYSDKAGNGSFPFIPAGGNRGFAGVFAPTLTEAGMLHEPQYLICASSPQAESGRRFELPTLREIDEARGLELMVMQRQAGGSYGYHLGFVVDGKLVGASNLGRSHFALVADAPSQQEGEFRTPNHGGAGQNLLYEDGHVGYVKCFLENDHPFRNHLGLVEPGVDRDDAVIAPSYAAPFQRGSTALISPTQ